jgi:hypothetical protein
MNSLQKWASLADEVNTIITEYPNLRLTRGKKVKEERKSGKERAF